MSDLSFQRAFSELPDQVWRGHALGQSLGEVRATGYAALDQALPGGGWPVGAMTEILQAQSGWHEWRLLLPALAPTLAPTSARSPIVLVGAPYLPFAPALAAQGLPASSLVWISPERPLQRLWACEQALRCAPVGAVLAWLPQAQADQLRRLHWAAHTYQKLLFVFRPAVLRQQSSPAPLRLEIVGPVADHLSPVPVFAPTHTLRVRVLKRRGPSLTEPLELPLQHPFLARALQASQWRQQQRSAVPEGASIEQGRPAVRPRGGRKALVSSAA